MWFSLATKAIEEKWQVEVAIDSAGLATNITVLDTNTTGSSISLPTTEHKKAT
ncbi:hypothetical protein [Scytonema sp. PCC 10023]|uniref:hypothetical protein n=1 Tax=Scytonema sp. PCC 10023 TaxID=1680591 RepID=UPI0039C5E331